MCYNDGRLLTREYLILETEGKKDRLAVYQVHGDSGKFTLLDTLELGAAYEYLYGSLSIDRNTLRIFAPLGTKGVMVACLKYDKLVVADTLTCVSQVDAVSFMPPDSAYVWDYDNSFVRVVDTNRDRIRWTLEKPETVRGAESCSLAVLGDSVMVGYGKGSKGSLVVYHHGSPAPVRVITNPGVGRYVINTDCRQHFILIYRDKRYVLVMDVNGNVRPTVNIDTNTPNDPEDCVVVNRQLWVGYENGSISIMSS